MSSISWMPPRQLKETLKTQIEQIATCLESAKKNEDKIHALASNLTPFIDTIQKEEKSPLSKLFVRWLGQKEGIRKGSTLDPEAVARHLASIPLTVPREKIKHLYDKMAEIIQLFDQINFPQVLHQPAFFKGVTVEQLDKNLSKSYHGIASILALISQLENSNIENIQKIIKDLKIWCSHYFVTAAKAPFIENSKDFINYPHGEYDEDNEPHYHREDGGAVVKKYLLKLRKLHPWLQREFHLNLIKNEEFSSLISIQCDLFKYKNKKVEWLEIDSLSLSEFPAQTVISEDHILFLDFSRLVQNKIYETKNIPQRNLIDEILRFQEDLSIQYPYVKIVYGAVAKNKGTQDFYFFYSKDLDLLKEFQEKFESLQACHGSYPEIMFLKRNLVELGTIEDLLIGYPVKARQYFERYLQVTSIYTPTYSEKDLQSERKELIDCITKLHQEPQNSKLLKFYFYFFFSLLNALPNSLIVKDIKIFEVVIERIRKIKKLLIQSKDSQANALKNFSLVVEHIQFLLVFFQVEQSEILSQLLSTQKPLVNEQIHKQAFTFTSGISCYGNIIETLAAIFSNDLTNVLFAENSYYELIEGNCSLRECMNRNGKFKCTVASFRNPNEITDLVKYRLVFADLHPNRVIYESVLTTDIKKIVEPILKNIETDEKKPLVLVLDCATTMFMHEEIQQILNEYSRTIAEGKLIIILNNSFAKYAMGGFDKFPGGATIVFGSHKTKNVEELCKSLTMRSKKDSLSPEANRTFYLLFKYCSESILFYLETIRENTDFLYEELKKEGLVLKIEPGTPEKISWIEPIQIGVRSKHIPMLGLHFNTIYQQLFGEKKIIDAELNVIVLLMQYYLLAKFTQVDLPTTLKQSFGFSSSNLIECWTALRFSVGLEDEDSLKKYATVIKKVNDELKDLLSKSLSRQNLSDKIQNLIETPNLKKKIYQKHALILREGNKKFDDFIDFFSDSNRERNLLSTDG